MIELYGYQYQALEWHLERRYSINAFTMGLGKTALALRFCEEVNGRALVVCPKFLIQNWKDEIKKFGVKANIDIISYSVLHKYDHYEYDVLIADEAHYLKNRGTRRSMSFRKLLNLANPRFFLMLTATPAKNDISEVYNLLSLAHRGNKRSEFVPFQHDIFYFKNTFMNCKKIRLNNRTIRKYEGVKNAAAFKKLWEPFIYRKTASDVVLPSQTHQCIKVGDLSFDEDFEKVESLEDEAYMTFKARVALAATEFTAKYVDGTQGQGIIFTDHIGSAAELGKKLECPHIDGSVDMGEREDIIKRFKDGEFQFLIGTYRTIGIGLNLVNANHMFFNDLPFVPSDLQQACGRIRRIGQKNPCFYYYILLSDVHEKIYKMIKKKVRHLRVLEK